MKLLGKSAKKTGINIKDYYAVNLGLIWKGLKQEDKAFWWLSIYFLFEYVRPQTLYPVLDILPWAQLSLILAILTAFTDQDVKWVRTPGNVLLFLFTAIVLASCVFGFDPYVSLNKIDIYLSWVVVYFLVITVINTEKRFFVFMLVFFLVNFKMSQFGFRDFITGGYSKWGVSGAPGWFRDSGDLGIEMTIFVSLAAAFIFGLQSYWGKYKKLFFYLLPITGVVTIIATSSRGAQLGMATAFLWFLIVNRRIKPLIGVLVVGSMIYLLIPPEMMKEYEVAGEDATSLARLELWGFGLDVIEDHPFIGVGYENWLDFCRYHNPNGFEHVDHCLVAHNSYVTLTAETGFLGLILYILLVVFIFIQNALTRANAKVLNNRFLSSMAYGLDGGLIAYSVATIFFTVIWYPFFWVQLALTVALHEISKKQLLSIQSELK